VAVADAELVSLHWERIQVVVRLRLLDVAIQPTDLRLQLSEESSAGTAVPPTHLDIDDGTVRLRFNVMLGPDQDPLRNGLWVLCGTTEPLRFNDGHALDPEVHGRGFGYRGGRYWVEPLIDEGGALILWIKDSRSPRRRRSIPKRLRKWWQRRVRHRTFDLLHSYFRATTTRSGRRVLFTSDSGSVLSGNLAEVHARMVARGLDREYEIETILKPSIAERRGWRDRWRLPRLLARADVILLNDYQPAIYRLPPDPGVRIIQLWHASGAFKTVGYSRVGKPGGPDPFSRRHKNYTHAIVSGSHDIPFYAEAFGLPEDRVVPTGIPRMDRFFDAGMRAAGLEHARRLFPMIEGRTTILLAPTFRGTGPRNASYAFELLDLEALHEVCREKDAVVIVKMHPFVRERIVIPRRLADRIIDGTDAPIDVNDLLFAVDVLITDYSSIVFEYSTLLRPMLFFAYDLEEYVESRDFYVPFEEFVPGRIAHTFDEVVDAIRRDAYQAEKVAAFAHRHFDHLDGGATDRVIDELILAR
jgi:CDP-ribitol ribitolphosphotransferase